MDEYFRFAACKLLEEKQEINNRFYIEIEISSHKVISFHQELNIISFFFVLLPEQFLLFSKVYFNLYEKKVRFLSQ